MPTFALVRPPGARYGRAVTAPRVDSSRLILVGGGARSGKSRFALGLARDMGERRVFVATAEALDQEMADRILNHQAERGHAFHTIEEPLALPQTLATAAPADVVLVDCLTLWVSNLLVRGTSLAAVEDAFSALESALERRRGHVILVSNEVGMGLVPETALGRAFRDMLGALHQRLSARADEIYAAIMGVVMRLHPAPVVVVMPPRTSATPWGRT